MTLTQKINTLQQQLESLIDEKSAIQQQYEHNEKALDACKTEIQSIKQVQEKLQHDHHKLSAEHQSLEQTHEHLVMQEMEKSKALAAKIETNASLEAKLNVSTEKMASLDTQLSKAQDKIERLRHDNSFLAGEKANLVGQLKQLEAVLSNLSTPNEEAREVS